MIVNNVETHVAQRAFRQVLEAFARPGTIGQIDAFPKKRRNYASAGLL